MQVQETSIMQVSDKYFFDNSKRSSCQQQYSTASTNKDYNSEHEHPTVRKLSTKSMSNTPLAERRLPYFITAWGKITQDQEIFSIVIDRSTKSYLQVSHFCRKYATFKRTIFIRRTLTFENVGERSFPKSATHTRVTFEQLLTCRRKGWREPLSDNSKKSQKIYSLQAFQFGKFALPEIPSRIG